ncbi:hypothetical protein Tco_0550548 [Tanacetum coccineum]
MEVGGMRISYTCCAFWSPGLLDVSFKSVKLVKFLVYLVSSHGWLGLSTQPTSREVDSGIVFQRRYGWGGSNGEVGRVEKVKALGANGEVSGSLSYVVVVVVVVERLRSIGEALENPFSLLDFWGLSSFDGRKLVHVGNRVKSVVVYGIILHILMRSRGRSLLEFFHRIMHHISKRDPREEEDKCRDEGQQQVEGMT